MAPEIILSGEKITASSDMWSVGISLIELYTSSEAWDLEEEDLKDILSRRLEPIGLDVLDHLNLPVRSCLHYDPLKRISAIQFLTKLQELTK